MSVYDERKIKWRKHDEMMFQNKKNLTFANVFPYMNP